MPEAVVRGADVVLEARIPSRGSAVAVGHLDQRCGLEPVEVKSRVQLVRPGQPFGSVRDLVLSTGYNRPPAGQRGLGVVVLVFGCAGGNQVKHAVSRRLGILDHDALPVPAVVADQPPSAGKAADRVGLEGPVLYQLEGRAVRVLDHADIVQQQFAVVEQPDDQLVPDVVADPVLGGDAPVHVGLPGALARLVAGRPGFGPSVIGVRVAKLQARTAAIGVGGPAAFVVVKDFVRGVAVGIDEQDQLPAVGKPA